MTKRKIGIVLAKPPGYSETFFRSKIVGLQKKGFEVSLFCQDNNENFDLCPTYTTPRKYNNILLQTESFFYVFLSLAGSWRSVINFIRLERGEGTRSIEIFKKVYLNAHILKADLDWLHYGFCTLVLKRELLAKSIGAKMAVSFRGFDLDVYPLKHPDCYSLLWTELDKAHSISQYLLEKAYSLGMPAAIDHKIVYPAVDMNLIGNTEINYKKRSPLKIVTVARLHWIKGIDLLIETARRLKQQNLEFEWMVIGGGEQKEEERYRFHIYEANLVEKVILPGRLSHSETLNALRVADLYIQTSWSEGFCNAILEAQALGLPSIAFGVGGIPENIIDCKTGWLVKDISSKAMAEKILDVVALPPEELKIVSQAARERVAANFEVEKQQLEFIEFYK